MRGIVVKSSGEWWLARSLNNWVPGVEGATGTFSRGCECVSHVLQALTEVDPETTVDGVSAFDLISREAMLDGLLQVDGGGAALPFVRLFYDRPSQHLWEDWTGTTWCTKERAGSRGIP